MNRIEEAYNNDPQREWDRLARHRVEYEITLRALAEHLLPAPAAVADIGGGVGRYAVELARQGYEVTLIDIAQRCLDFARARAGEAGVALAGVVRSDARDLSGFADGSFDVVLLMGPLYHLQDSADRLAAAREARRVLKPGGKVIATFITRFCIFVYAAVHEQDMIVTQREIGETALATGALHQPEGSAFPPAWLARPEEVGPLMAEGGFRQTDLLTCEPLIFEREDGINAAEDELHSTWIDLLYRLCREPSILGAGAHLLYAGVTD